MSTASPLPTQSANEYQALMDRIVAEMKPSTEHETFLVTLMVQARWKLTRIQHKEEEFLARTMTGEPVGDRLALLIRYSAAAERSYYKAHRELIQSRRQRETTDLAAFETELLKSIEPPTHHASASFGNSPKPYAVGQTRGLNPNGIPALMKPVLKT